MLKAKPFSSSLQKKIDALSGRRAPCQLGTFTFPSKLLLAPMASIGNAPFRLLMQQLGAGATVSELISSHGINYKNDHTLKMLRIDPQEENIGIQLFGEDAASISAAALVAQEAGAKWIDINMGCPVKKVVTKGAGAALLRNPSELGKLLEPVAKILTVPLTIKIRMGWDQDQMNADEIIHIAKESGIAFVAIHGRTRAQQYTGRANWEYLENLASKKILPLVGNGDLHSPHAARARLKQTSCDALMIARGALRNPFIFLESFAHGQDTEAQDSKSIFNSSDTFEVIERMASYHQDFFDREGTALIQLKKYIAWYAAGFPHAVSLRQKIFTNCTMEDALNIAQDFFQGNPTARKPVGIEEGWMTSGHG